MQGNLNPSARAGIAGVIAPQQAAVGAITTGWIDMVTFFSLLALISVGVIGANGTIDASIDQATDANGTGEKPVPGSAITQLAKAGGDNRQVAINLRPEDLDKNAGFRFVRLTVTVGGASTFLAAMILGFDPRYGPADANDLPTVAQIAG